MNEGLRNGQNTNEPKKCLIVLILWAQRLETNENEFLLRFNFHVMRKRAEGAKGKREKEKL